MMNPTDLADATTRALDLLPDHDPARSDPRLVREPGLAEEARLTKDTAAAVWLAVSPLRTAPPEVLRSVMAEIHPSDSRYATRQRPSVFWLAASGWAAAAVIAISLWPESSVTRPASEPTFSPTAAAESNTNDSLPRQPMPDRDSKIRREIVKLQERLASLQKDPAYQSPRVISLNAPGVVRRTPEEARQRVRKILTDALRSALEAEGGAVGDNASLVIERGWVPGGLPVLQEGEVIRHRHFPVEDWLELGLSRSADGSYYDASSLTIWEPDPEGRGYIGRKASAEEEISQFTKETEQQSPGQKTPAQPEGFIVDNPVDGSTDIVVENLPALAADGQLVVQATGLNGVIDEIPLTLSDPAGFVSNTISAESVIFSKVVSTSLSNSAPGRLVPANADGVAYSGNIVGYMNLGSLILSFPSNTIPGSFQLIERGAANTGTPDKIIVTSQP